MRTIFISATMRDSGQSLLTWLLAEELIGRGLKVGLFRPMGVRGPGDVDPLMKLLFDALGDQVVGEPECPVLIDPEGGVDPNLVDLYLQKIKDGFAAVQERCDICLTIGSRDVYFDADQTSLPDTRFIEMFDARVILIDSYLTKAMTVYSTLALASFLRDRLNGIVINRVPQNAWDEFAGETAPYLKEKGAPILAVLPEDKVIKSPTLKDLAELLDADILCGEDHLERLAIAKTISAHDLPKSMNIYKRVVNKVLFTGGTHEAIAQGADPTTCGVLLTQGRAPAEAVVKAAKKEGVPVLLTKLDTFAAIEKIEKEKIYIKPRDRFRLERFKTLLSAPLTMDDLISCCEV